MALIMGPLRPDATYGEKIVYEAIKDCLPDDYMVWPELPVQGEEERKRPDFVLLHRLFGVIVLEVKDCAPLSVRPPSRRFATPGRWNKRLPVVCPSSPMPSAAIGHPTARLTWWLSTGGSGRFCWANVSGVQMR